MGSMDTCKGQLPAASSEHTQSSDDESTSLSQVALGEHPGQHMQVASGCNFQAPSRGAPPTFLLSARKARDRHLAERSVCKERIAIWTFPQPEVLAELGAHQSRPQ
eukprot:CAMPEP_0177732746 /NCGR_PEP_ID=MMETSP0484_2-20121128/23289_1 /TAXON_ID=354590 /ORGANISM="Rhodomonas lens, Strain RHODO" /LENGTH=105 /DNA_ID=CAMNT_0019246027 /DNA_START=89 /DNA_END=406 /DNA_ORIENTATION=+